MHSGITLSMYSVSSLIISSQVIVWHWKGDQRADKALDSVGFTVQSFGKPSSEFIVIHS